MASFSLCSSDQLEHVCQDIHGKLGRLDLLAPLLASRHGGEICRIKDAYAAMHHEDLVECFCRAHEINDQDGLASAIHLRMVAPHERDAIIARDAIQRFDVRYRALIEIYACRKPSQLFRIKQAYKERFNTCLDHDAISEPSHACQRILVALAASQKAHQTDLSQHIAKCDAKRLYDAGKGGAGGVVDEGVMLEMISKRTIPQLRLAVSSYKHIYGHSYTKWLKKMSGEFEESLYIVINCLYDPPRYFSKMLHLCINGMTQDKSMLTRVIVTRVEVDMEEIKKDFQSKYKMGLCEALGRSKGIEKDYKEFLADLSCLSNKK